MSEKKLSEGPEFKLIFPMKELPSGDPDLKKMPKIIFNCNKKLYEDLEFRLKSARKKQTKSLPKKL